MVKVILAALILALAGCAQPQQGYVKKVEIKHDLGSGIDLALSLHSRDNGSIVVSDSHNQRGRVLRLWFWQETAAPDQKVLRGIMYYEGDKKVHREVFQVPPSEAGLTERFWVEAFDKKEGKLLMRSEPIVSESLQGR